MGRSRLIRSSLVPFQLVAGGPRSARGGRPQDPAARLVEGLHPRSAALYQQFNGYSPLVRIAKAFARSQKSFKVSDSNEKLDTGSEPHPRELAPLNIES